VYYSHKLYLCVHHKSKSHGFRFGDVAGHNLWAIYCFLKTHGHCDVVGSAAQRDGFVGGWTEDSGLSDWSPTFQI
jgi:hypothetical protein